MLAHKAEEDAVAAVEMMAGRAGHVDYSLVPGIVYTAPEIATLGQSEETLKVANIDYKKGVFPFSANSRARAQGHNDGFVKILACSRTDKVLGVHIIGHEAGTVIHECATAMAFGALMFDYGPDCRRRVIDVSGDGKHNNGFRPHVARQMQVMQDVTVNALVIEGAEPEVLAYYLDHVISGQGAFVEIAAGYEDYSAALRRKLLREIPMSVVDR